MNKQLILNSLHKTFLNLTGIAPEDYYIFLTIKDNRMLVKSTNNAFNSLVISTVSIDNIKLPDASVVIREPDKLLKLLNLAEDDIEFLLASSKKDVKLHIKYGKCHDEYNLADPMVLSESIREQGDAYIEEPLSYDFSIPITTELVDNFSKRKKALSTEIATLEVKDRMIKFQLGDISTYSNKSSFLVEIPDGMFDIPIMLFSADTMLSIFDRNKGMNGKIQLDPDGFMKISYEHKIDNSIQKADYFLLPLDQI